MKYEKFKCDNEQCCATFEKQEAENIKKFYAAGWKFLYQLELKIDDYNTKRYSNGHFCSDGCMVEWMKSELNKLKEVKK